MMSACSQSQSIQYAPSGNKFICCRHNTMRDAAAIRHVLQTESCCMPRMQCRTGCFVSRSDGHGRFFMLAPLHSRSTERNHHDLLRRQVCLSPERLLSLEQSIQELGGGCIFCLQVDGWLQDLQAFLIQDGWPKEGGQNRILQLQASIP